MKIESWRFRRVTSTVLLLSGVVFAMTRAEAGSLVIPAWSFARGNVRVDANPDQYADAGPVVLGGPKRPWGDFLLMLSGHFCLKAGTAK